MSKNDDEKKNTEKRIMYKNAVSSQRRKVKKNKIEMK